MDFVEVGTCDFETLIQNASDVTFGLSIEGIKSFLDKLPDKPNVKKIHRIVSDHEGEAKIFSVRSDLLYRLPEWVRGSNSIHEPHPIVLRWLKQNGLPTDIFESHVVQQSTLFNILMEYDVDSIDFLKIDAEGHDEVILKRFLKDINTHHKQNLLPRKMQFECNELHTTESVSGMIEILNTYNYHVVKKNNYDVMLEWKIEPI